MRDLQTIRRLLDAARRGCAPYRPHDVVLDGERAERIIAALEHAERMEAALDQAVRDAHRLAMQRDAAIADLAACHEMLERAHAAIHEALNALDGGMPLVAATTLLGATSR